MSVKMMNRFFITISIWSLALSMTAFPQAQPQKPPAGSAPAEEPLPVLSVPKDYHYNARGRRDPFVNPVPPPPVEARKPPIIRPPGLRGVLIAEANIVGVVTSKESAMNVVIISAPGAKSPYFARVGDQLFDAVVTSIKLDTVTFALTVPGGGNERTPREIVRKVRPVPGEDK